MLNWSGWNDYSYTNELCSFAWCSSCMQTLGKEMHPSGLEDGELALVSAEFFSRTSGTPFITEKTLWYALLSFQQGWKACKDFYKVKE